ncbi:MAG: MerR family transcriptional regulator [Desulfobulbaceae bacterium]|nr:MerR family transcriptional regulator [Desulfobulbaceae bacterium]
MSMEKRSVKQLAREAGCDESNIRHYIRKGRLVRDAECRFMVMYDVECRRLLRSIKSRGRNVHPGRKKTVA